MSSHEWLDEAHVAVQAVSLQSLPFSYNWELLAMHAAQRIPCFIGVRFRTLSGRSHTVLQTRRIQLVSSLLAWTVLADHTLGSTLATA